MKRLRASADIGRGHGKGRSVLGTIGAVGAMLALGGPAAAQGVYVSASDSSPTFIGSLTEGQKYDIKATGISDLATSNDLTFSADGIPTYTFTGSDSFFSPNGSDYVPLQNNSYGVGGIGELYGALLGTYLSSGGTFFTIGESDVITATQSGALYGIVNDCPLCYSDNAGGYYVTLTSGVPEPTAWTIMLVGLSALGAVYRRGRRSAFSSTFVTTNAS
jgi:hypothetical protein